MRNLIDGLLIITMNNDVFISSQIMSEPYMYASCIWQSICNCSGILWDCTARRSHQWRNGGGHAASFFFVQGTLCSL